MRIFMKTNEEFNEMRKECHALIDVLDKNGLEEAMQSLKEMVEYYKPEDWPKVLPPIS